MLKRDKIQAIIDSLPEHGIKFEESFGHSNIFSRKYPEHAIHKAFELAGEELEKDRNEFAIRFARWYSKLTPVQRCTIWPPAGSGSGLGLYEKSMDELMKKFIEIENKVCVNKVNGVCPLHNVHCAYPECEKVEI